MRIIEVCYEFPPIGGGGGTFTSDILKDLSRRGHAIDVVTMRGPGTSFRERPQDNLTVYRVPSMRTNSTHCSLLAAAIFMMTGSIFSLGLIARRRYDCVHSTFVFPSAVIGHILSWLTRNPHVITAHGSDVPGHNDRFSSLFAILLLPWKHIVRNASRIITVSDYLKECIRKVTDRPIDVIPLGVDPARFPQTSYGKKIVMIGRLQEFKGMQYTLKALAKLPDQPYEVHIIGDGPYMNDLKRLSKELNQEVHFRGWLTREEVIEEFTSSSILVSMSSFESFGGVIMEAMACGLAVVATDVGGCHELMADTGVIVKPKDEAGLESALEDLLKNPREIQNIGERARQRVSSFYDISDVGRAYEDLFKQTWP